MLWRFPASSADDDRLQSLPTAAPGAGLNGLWRSADASGATALHLLVRRAAVEDALKVRWLLTDPLGRATERTLSVPAGSPLPAPDLLSPAVTKRANVGFIVTFQTSVPVPATAAGPYKLRVRYTPAKPSPFPQLGRAALPPIVEFETLLVPRPPAVRNAADALRLPQVHSLELALADIPPAMTGEDLFAGSMLIPVRRSRAPNRRTALAVGLRGSGGRVELAILAPDGRSASVRLDLV